MKIAKRSLAVLLACLMVFGSLGMVGSAKGNTSWTVDPIEGGTATGTVTYGLDIYKVEGSSLLKLSDGDTLAPGDVVEVQLCFGTDFYLGQLTTQVFFDSTVFEPYLGGAVYTTVPMNTFKTDPGYIKMLKEGAPTADTKNEEYKNVTLFDTIPTVENGGLQGYINQEGKQQFLNAHTPLAWRVPDADGNVKQTYAIKDEYKNLHQVGLQITCNSKSDTTGYEIIVPYAPYFSFQLRVKDDVTHGKSSSIFIPMDGRKENSRQTCNRLFAFECDTTEGSKYASSGVPSFGQGLDLTKADFDCSIHTFGEPAWSWSDDYSTVSATFTCTCGETKTVTADIDTKIIATPASCGVNEVDELLEASALFNGKYYSDSKTNVEIPGTAKEHDFSVDWLWEDDYSAATATFTCKNGCGIEDEKVNASIEPQVVTPATCEGNRSEIHIMTANFMGKDYTGKTEEVEVPNSALGHDYGEPEWKWADDYSTATATFTCSRCPDVQNIKAVVEPETVSEATCTADKVMTYTATATFAEASETPFTDKKENITIEDTATGHSYSTDWHWADDYSSATVTLTCAKGDDVQEDIEATVEPVEVSPATCTADKVVTFTATATYGGETYTDEKKNITIEGSATGHTYGEPEWKWADDYSTATATFVCACGDDTQIVTADVKEDVLSELSCTTDKVATYTAAVKFGGKDFNDAKENIVVTPQLGHDWAAELSFIDNDTHGIKCSRCTETKDVAAHDYSILVEVTKEPTDEQTGEKILKCSGCGHEKTFIILQLNHEPEWKWADDYSTATATFSSTDGEHTETVNAAIDIVEVSQATCTADKVVNYIATATYGDKAYTDTKENIALKDTATGHSYGEPEWAWAADYSTATATFTCLNGCGDKQPVNATIDVTIVSEATCTEDKVVTYTATAKFKDKDYPDTKENIALKDTATGHSYGEPEWAWAADYSTAKATFTCQNGCGDKQNADATIDIVEVSPATCTADKVVNYIATAKFKDKDYTDKKENNALAGTATGHEYVAAEWTWAADYSTATVKLTCKNCNDPQTANATITRETVSDATVDADQVVTYTATATYNGTEYTDKKENISVPGTKLPPAQLVLFPEGGKEEEGSNSLSLNVDYIQKSKVVANLAANIDGVKYSVDKKGSRIVSVDEKTGEVKLTHLSIFTKTATIYATTTAADGSTKTATCTINIKLKWYQYIIYFLFGYFWY